MLLLVFDVGVGLCFVVCLLDGLLCAWHAVCVVLC